MPDTMKAAVLEAYKKPLVIKNVPYPKPGPGEVTIKILASGLCASDLHLQDGMIPSSHVPYIPGHEMVGEIFELGEGVDRRIGERVLGFIDTTCGVCRLCTSGRANLCMHLKRLGFEMDGSHARYCRLPARNAVPISREIPVEKVAVIPDAVACMYHAIKAKGQVRAGDRVLILGVGGLGIQGIQILKHFGAEVYVTSRQDRKLEIAASFGADVCINTGRQDLYEEIRKATNGEMCDVVLDNIGISGTIEDSLRVLRPAGKVVVIGYAEPEFTAVYQHIMLKEKEIIGCRASNLHELKEAVRLVEQGVIDPYIYRTYPFEEINQALDDLRAGKALGRTVLVFEDERIL